MSSPSETRKKCAICSRPVQERYKPFCSQRCANIDLGRWLNEAYRIPAKLEVDNDEDVPDQAPKGQDSAN